MGPGPSVLRSGASVIASLVIAASFSGGVSAAPSRGQDAGVSSRPALPMAGSKLRPRLTEGSRTSQVRGSVNVRRLAAKKPTKRPVATLPQLGTSGASGGPTNGGTANGSGPKVAAVAPPPADATTNADGPAAQTGFPGLAQTPSSPTSGEPPDPWVAVGPEHVVQAVSLELRMTDRAGTDKLTVSLPDFFNLPTDPVSFDAQPRVVYDSLHGRWLATELSWDCDETDPNTTFGHGYIDVAVSRTTDPTGVWDLGFIQFDDQLPYNVVPGTSTDKVAYGSNVYNMTASGIPNCGTVGLTFTAGDILVEDWADLLNGGGDALDEYFGTSLISPRVAVQAPATSAALQIVEAYDNGDPGTLDVAYFILTGSVVKNTTSIAGWDLTADGIVSAFADPPQPIQPGGTITSPLDLRPTDAVWQGNRLVFVSTYPCSGRDCVRVTELDTTGASATVEPTHDPGLPRPRDRQGHLHGRRRADRQRHPPRRLDPVVREPRGLPLVVCRSSGLRRHAELDQRT